MRAYEAGRAVVETGADLAQEGLEEAWDTVKDVRLPGPVIKVPW